jgi:hypothetical protein
MSAVPDCVPTVLTRRTMLNGGPRNVTTGILEAERIQGVIGSSRSLSDADRDTFITTDADNTGDSDVIGVAVGGITAMRIEDNAGVAQTRLVDGTAAAPALAFISDPNTGLISGFGTLNLVAANGVAFQDNAGTVSMTFDQNVNQFRGVSGTAAEPVYSFNLAPDGGLYHNTVTDHIAIAESGTEVASFDNVRGIGAPIGVYGGGDGGAHTQVAGLFSIDPPDDIAAGVGGPINELNHLTTVNVGAVDDAFGLVDATIMGTMKRIRLVTTGGGNAVITPDNLANGTTITLGAANASVLLMWYTDGNGWVVVDYEGAVVIA